jgi:hypothetical protein
MAWFGSMRVDPVTLGMWVGDEIPEPKHPTSDYYFQFPYASGDYSVAHYGTGDQTICYNYFEVRPDNRLITRFKRQVLLAGEFGTVYGESTYFYDPMYAGQANEFFTVSNMNGVGVEPFRVAPALPAGTNLSLDAVSVIRVFREAPEFLIVSANYAPDGHLESLHVNGAKHGDWVHSNEIKALYPDLGVATMIGDRPQTREHFGLPATFPTRQYLQKPANTFARVALNSVMDVINLHYDRNRWVRQESFLPDGTRSVRFLTYVITEEDKALDPVDNSRMFGRFSYTRNPGQN